MGLYTIVDTNALSAINIVCPIINIIVGLGTRLATGGSAIELARWGMDMDGAKKIFTLTILSVAIIGILITSIGLHHLCLQHYLMERYLQYYLFYVHLVL